MALLRYKYLRKRGYKTITGADYRDPDTYHTWTELIMQKGNKLKFVRVDGPMKLAEFKELEARDEQR